jgi:hypothetical protein
MIRAYVKYQDKKERLEEQLTIGKEENAQARRNQGLPPLGAGHIPHVGGEFKAPPYGWGF